MADMDFSCISVVLDTSLSESKGHFLQLTIDLCESLERNQRYTRLLTRNHSLIAWFNSKNFKYLAMNLFEDSDSANFYCHVQQTLSEIGIDQNVRKHLIVLRAKDLPEEFLTKMKNNLAEDPKLYLEVLINVSGIISGSKEAQEENIVLQRFTDIGDRVTFLTWDKRIESFPQLPSVRFLPEPKAVNPRMEKPQELTIGFYGKLSYERGLFDLLVSVFVNPKLSYRIIGYGFNHRYLYRSKKFVSFSKTPVQAALSLLVNYLVQLAFMSPKVVYEQRYFNDELEMSKDIQKCSATFFSCAHSPYSSGLVYQSLASEVPVIWAYGRSAVAAVLSDKFPNGMIKRKTLITPGALTKAIRLVENHRPSSVFDFDDFDRVFALCGCNLESTRFER